MAARREKGLCYNCDESFVYGHRCKQRITYMIMADSIDEEQTDCVIPGFIQEEETEMSLNSLNGQDGTTTMRIFGECNKQSLHILIDSGSTISFIGASVAPRLNCKLTPEKPLLVKVANGQRMVSDKRVDCFKWNIQQREFCYSLRLLETDCCDLILGGDWLKSCTPIGLDYEKMTITVTLAGEKVKLRHSLLPGIVA